MARTQGTITLGSAGTLSFNLGLAPTWVKFTVCEKFTGDNVSHFSYGMANSTKQFCMSTFSDPSGADSFNSNAHVVRQYERINGTVDVALSASFNSFTSTGIKLDVDIPHAGYQVLVEAGN